MTKFNQEFAINEEELSRLKDQNTPQTRLFNWNCICNELDKIGIIVESDIKSLFVAGDQEEMAKLYKRIERYILRLSGDDEILNFTDYRKDTRKIVQRAGVTNQGDTLSQKNNESTMNFNNGGRKGLQANQRKNVKDGVDIMLMDTLKDPSLTESTLEFILNTLCRALNMKPKQSAALLTNNNQFLIHCCVKGVKSQYEPMINWYTELYQFSRHLSNMLEIESENAYESKDPRLISASQMNFEKVMQTISCGCYSNNFEVAQLCVKVLSYIAQDFNGNIELVQMGMKWFQTNETGIYTIYYAFKKHPELCEEFVSCVSNFTGGGELMTDVYLNLLQQFCPEPIEYLNQILNIFPYLIMNNQQQLTNSNFLNQLFEKTVRFADTDTIFYGDQQRSSPSMRMTAISMLNEIWLNFPSFIGSNEGILNHIQNIYKKNLRDKMKSSKMITAACLFKLLDNLSAERNPAAPQIYKLLIFSLVENPQDQSVRELYLSNFQSLFQSQPSIPVSLLVDPLVKSSQMKDSFVFQTFDYDFFTYLAGHGKLNVQNAIQMLDLLAKLYLNDLCNASAASVPFMIVCSRFGDTIPCQEFIMKFITIVLNQLLQLCQEYDEATRITPGLDQGKKVLALPPARGKGTLSSMSKPSGLDVVKYSRQGQGSTKKKQILSKEDEINKRLKKSLIVTILLKIQNLRQEDVNNAMRDMVIGAQKQYKDQNNGYLYNGFMEILKYWGDPDLIFDQYQKHQEKVEQEEKKHYERLHRQEQTEKKMLGYDSEDRPQQNIGGAEAAYQSLTAVKSLKSTKAVGRKSMALMPISESQHNMRALHELEMIKKYKKEKELEERLKQERNLRKQNIIEMQLKEELKKRRIEVGVHERTGGVKQEIRALIFKEDELKQGRSGTLKRGAANNLLVDQALKKVAKGVALVNISEEEDRDRELIQSLMQKYSKLWKSLFGRYANQGYSHKGKRNFDELTQKFAQINLAEVTKMLKDHKTYPDLISKNELTELIRLINVGSQAENSKDITCLDYNQFLQLIPQLAFLCFSRAPIDKSHLPPVELLNALLTQFGEATRARGQATALYEDPDSLSSFHDKELIKAFEQQLASNPSFNVPEGFVVKTEKIPVYQYTLPDCAKSILGESRVVVAEVLDEIFFQAIGVHFLEPRVSFISRKKVKTAITRTKGSLYPKKVEVNSDEAQHQLQPAIKPAQTILSAEQKRKESLDVKPNLNLALKMQVTRQDLKNRPQWQEVAEVFEEMLQAVEKGESRLPPRRSRAPGQLLNEAKKLTAEQQQLELLEKQRKEAKRLDRDQEVKKMIKEAHGGDMSVYERKVMKVKQEKAEAERAAKSEKELFQQHTKAKKEQIDQIKLKNLEEIQKKQDEERQKENFERQQTEKQRKEFLVKQKAMLSDQFAMTQGRRDTLVALQQEKKAMEKQNELRMKELMQKYLSESKVDREVEKKERIDIVNFLEDPEAKKVFEAYQKPLLQIFKFYAAQDTLSKLDKQADPAMAAYADNMLSFKELVRFGYQQNITPTFLSPEELVYIYKILVREQVDISTEKSDADSIRSRTSGMIDFTQFKKALVRICIMAQSHKGARETLQPGVNQELLGEKLRLDQAKQAQEMEMKKQLKTREDAEKAKKQAELERLKEQFSEDYKNRQDAVSRHPKDKYSEQAAANGTVNKQPTISKQARLQEKQYQLDEQKLAQEEEFFNKWMKQRENRIKGSIKEEKLGDQNNDNQRLRSNTKNDRQDIEQFKLLKDQMKSQKKIAKLEIENKNVRKPLNVDLISARTIEALFQYLDLAEQGTSNAIAQHLTQTLNQRNTIKQKTNVI